MSDGLELVKIFLGGMEEEIVKEAGPFAPWVATKALGGKILGGLKGVKAAYSGASGTKAGLGAAWKAAKANPYVMGTAIGAGGLGAGAVAGRATRRPRYPGYY